MYLILVAGMPATGKTTFAKYLSEQLQIPMVSKDEIKELLFDSVGFHSRAEKVALGAGSMEIAYYFTESLIRTKKSVILENNFENDSKPGLVKLTEKYHCNTITILFDGELTTVYRRFVERDKSPTRHRGHVVNTEYPEKSGAEDIPSPLSFENFVKGVNERGIRDFSVGGEVIRVDTTDFSKMSYSGVVQQVIDRIGRSGL